MAAKSTLATGVLSSAQLVSSDADTLSMPLIASSVSEALRRAAASLVMISARDKVSALEPLKKGMSRM